MVLRIFAILGSVLAFAMPSRTAIHRGDRVVVHGTHTRYDHRKGVVLRNLRHNRSLVRLNRVGRRRAIRHVFSRRHLQRLRPKPRVQHPPSGPSTAPSPPAVSPPPPPAFPPLTDPGDGGPCTTTVSSTSALQSTARSAADGSVVCVQAGSYGAATLAGSRSGYVTVRPADGASVNFSSLSISSGSSYYDVRGFTVGGEITIPDGGASHVILHGLDAAGVNVGAGTDTLLIDHNNLHGGGFGVLLSSSDCRVPGAPQWSGCQSDPEAPISNVTINGNRFTGPFGEDAMQLKNFRNVTVTDNEITNVREDGSHNDCTQTVYGGQGLVYRGNYQHDNRCQGLFIKDGRVTDVDVEDNMFVRNSQPCLGETCSSGAPLTITFYDTVGLIFRNNVLWDNANGAGGSMLQTGNSGIQWDHNVLSSFVVSDTSTYSNASNLKEDYDVFGDARNWNGFKGSHSVVQSNPGFRDTGSADYRLSQPVSAGGATYNAGVTWRPADKHFGP
jgi:hypothetical protein